MSNLTPSIVLCQRAPDGVVEIPIIGDIGGSVNGQQIIRDLMAFRPKEVKFVVYSPGGMVFDALAVYQYMKKNGITSYTEIYGFAASAATVFAAHSGPKRTSIAPGTPFMIHNASGAEDDILAGVNKQLAEIYAEAYGWTVKEAAQYMAAETTWFPADAKKIGICSEIMQDLRVAAHFNINTTAMAENKIKATVKLTLAQALSAVTGSGTEVEVDADQVTADALAEKDTRIAQLETELAESKAKTVDEAANAEALNTATQEAITAKADLATAVQAKATEIEAIKAAHLAEIAALKAPLASKTVADNQAAAVGAMPGTKVELTQGESIVKTAMQGTNPLMKAQADMEREKVKA